MEANARCLATMPGRYVYVHTLMEAKDVKIKVISNSNIVLFICN